MFDTASTSTSDDPDQIEAEIEHTRAEMSETIDAIQERLSPDAIKAQAKEAVREATIGKVQEKVSNVRDTVTEKVSAVADTVTGAVTGRHDDTGFATHSRETYAPPPGQAAYGVSGGYGAYGDAYDTSRPYGQYRPSAGWDAHGTTGSSSTFGDAAYRVRRKSSGMLETVRANPIPAAMVGVGIGWLLTRNNRDFGSQPYYYNPDRHTTRAPIFSEEYGQPGQSPYRSYGQHQSGRVEQLGSTLQEKAGAVQETAGELTNQAREQVGQVTGQVGQLPHMARDQAQDMRYWYHRQLNQSPMMLGVAAIGLGALVGLLLPETERESQLMGEKRDELVDRAQMMAQETMQKVQTVAQEVGSTVQQTVQDSAQQQGLTAG